MSELQSTATAETLKSSEVLKSASPLILVATLGPVGGADRFQPAGFPEIGHVIYKAPRSDGTVEQVCIVDSAASMANHLESVCMRGPHDLDLSEDLIGMPYLRCVTDGDAAKKSREVVVTSLTEGHRIASTYFLAGKRLQRDTPIDKKFEDELADEIGIKLPGNKRAHVPAAKWWNVFKAIFKYDPNALVHGVLFPQWQIKIPRMLTAHLEAFGAGRVDRSGVKFDRIGKTTSGQPIFAVDDATAREIRATFILDLALLRSFGRKENDEDLGLNDKQKEFLVALALWKIHRLLSSPFRFRSGCHLGVKNVTHHIDVNIQEAIKSAKWPEVNVTDLYWPVDELYREPASPKDGVPSDETVPEGDGEEDNE